MDSVRNATFRIAFRRIVSSCAPFAASRLVDTMRLLFILKWQCSLQAGKSLDRHMAAFFYPEMAILTLEKASRAYRTLRGAFLISENGKTRQSSTNLRK